MNNTHRLVSLRAKVKLATELLVPVEGKVPEVKVTHAREILEEALTASKTEFTEPGSTLPPPQE